MIALAILQLAIAILVPLLMAFLIAWGTTRRAILTRPLCGRCRTPLPFAAAVGEAPCPGCQEPVDESHPPVPARRRGWNWPIALASVLFLLVLIVPVMVAMVATRQSIGMAGAADTRAMFQSGIRRPEPIDLHLPTLRQRALAGEDVVGIARETMRSSLPTTPPQRNAPMTSVPEIASIALLGLPGSPAPPPDEDLASRILIACFPPLEIDSADLGQGRISPAYTGFIGPQWHLQRVARVTLATLDGAPIELQPIRGARAPLLFDRANPLRYATPAMPASGRLVLNLEVRLYSSFDAERIVDRLGVARPPELWPEPLATTTMTLEVDVAARP